MKLRNIFLFASFIAACFALPFVSVARETPLISQQMVEPYGLTRVWFNQVDIDQARSKVLHAIVEGGTMFVVTDDAKLHALNAETGQSLWGRTLGRREMVFQEPAVNSRMVFALNGLEMFIFDRRNGKLLQHIPLPGAASTGCDASENYVYIPMMNRRIIAYPLVDVDGPKLEEEGGAGSEALLSSLQEDQQTPRAEGIEDAEESVPGVGSSEHEDPVLANIVKRFAEAKESVMAEAAPPEKEKEVVLRPALGIPMTSISFGTVMVKPTVASQYVIFNKRNRVNAHWENVTWVTETGLLVSAAINSLSTEEFELQYSIDSSSQTYFLGSERIARRDWESDKELGARPTVNQCIPAFYTEKENRLESSKIPSMVVVGGKAAYVFAVKDRLGEVAWQFAASGPITERIAVVGTEVFCSTSTGGMHALNLLDGKEKWYTPNIKQFIAASKNRIYTLDRKSRVVILDRQSGTVLNSFDARHFDRFLFNIQNDRIYVVNDSGLIQCLRERQPQALDNLSDQDNPPTWHRLTCKEYADVMLGKPVPTFYWQDAVNADGGGERVEAGPNDEDDEGIETGPSNATPPARPTDEEEAEDPFS